MCSFLKRRIGGCCCKLNIQAELEIDHLFTVEPLGFIGGLALFSMDEFQVNVLFSNNRMIDIETIIDGIKVFMTFVYGDHVLERRDQVWERLTRFSTTRNGSWFMIGDFNEIASHNEKEGGRRRSDSSFLPFKQMLNDCGILEFPFTGNMLSWVGKRSGGTTVRCRLDRAVGNEDWRSFHIQLVSISGFGVRIIVRSWQIFSQNQ